MALRVRGIRGPGLADASAGGFAPAREASSLIAWTPTAAAWARVAAAWPIVWLSGVLLVVVYFAGGHLRLWRIRRASVPAPVEWQTAAARAARAVGLDTVPHSSA
ncbi:MAG: hypothetical protein R2712_15150 [Vicinamibacterales bacterium]